MNVNRYCSWEEAVEWLVHQHDKQELVRACYFDRPLIFAAERYWRSHEWQAVRDILKRNGGRALDVGAGNGIASYALAKDGWLTTALEPNPSLTVGSGAIRTLAREAALPIQIVEEFGERLPFDDNSFAVIHARQVLHHARDLPLFCSELFRVLQPGGILIATREHVISSPKQLPYFLDRHPLHHMYGGENAFTKTHYKTSLIKTGFRMIKVFGPFDSVINFAPYSREALLQKLSQRFVSFPGGKMVYKLFFSKNLCDLSLRVLSQLDRRPGRLCTFVAQKDGIVNQW